MSKPPSKNTKVKPSKKRSRRRVGAGKLNVEKRQERRVAAIIQQVVVTPRKASQSVDRHTRKIRQSYPNLLFLKKMYKISL